MSMGFWKRLVSSFRDNRNKRPEDYYETEITEEYVKFTHPRRKAEQIKWDEIEEIRLVNTDEGPFLPDIWLVLTGNNKGCSIPHATEGWNRVYDIVSKYDGFNFENVTKSMSCRDNEIFELWKQ
jgi:hypothetical protein